MNKTNICVVQRLIRCKSHEQAETVTVRFLGTPGIGTYNILPGIKYQNYPKMESRINKNRTAENKQPDGRTERLNLTIWPKIEVLYFPHNILCRNYTLIYCVGTVL